MKYSILGLLSLLFTICSNSLSAQSYKEMMYDYQYNFYYVVKAAEAHFNVHGTGKGSGYKNYQRWKYENEGHFYPSGRRDNVSPYFVENGFAKVQATIPRGAERAGQILWEDMGPYDANVVTSHYSQGIGRVEDIYIDPNDDQRLYLGSRSGGFWFSTDGGSNWTCSTDTLIATGVNTIAVSPTNPDSVLINVRNARNGYSHGVFKSGDGGRSWTRTTFNPVNLGWGGLGKTGQINVVSISPHNANLVFVGTDRGLYKSTDNMATYSIIRSGNYSQVDFHPTKSNIVYAYDRNNPNRNVVMRSTDTGNVFRASASIPNNNGNNNGRLSTSKACAGCVYFSSNNGVWISVDEGQNFTFRSNPSQSGGGFAVSDVDTNRMIYGYVDLTASNDGGANFNQVTYWSTGNSSHRPDNYIHADLRIARSVKGVFYVGTDGYMAKSTDGGNTWERLNDGTGIREFYRLGLSQSNKDLTMAGSQDNGTSIYTTNGWIEWNGGDGMEAVTQQLNQDWLIGSWQYGNRNRTTNGGQSRQNVKHGGSPDWNAPMFYNPNHQFQVFSFAEDVYVSNVFGGSWQTRANFSAGVIKKASVAENNPNIMLMVRNADLWLSVDGGNTVTNMRNKLPHTASIADIAFDPNNDSTVVMVYETYQDNNRRVYISNDLCNSWTNISYNLSPMPANDVVLDDRGNIYIAAEIGVFTMPIGGTAWENHGTGIPNVSFEELEIQWATNMLRGVSWGRGMWQAPLVGRSDYPKMNNISIDQTPTLTTPAEDFPQHVTVETAYSGALNKVYVLWSKDSTYFNNVINLSLQGTGDFRTDSPIPAFAAGTDMYFKVIAVGQNGDTTTSYKFHYTYQPCNGQPTILAQSTMDTVCAGEGFSLSAAGGNWYQWDDGVNPSATIYPTQSKTYVVKGWVNGSCAGMDSVRVEVETLDTSITRVDSAITATQLNASYQWLDCSNGFSPISGATQRTFVGTAGGSYAVRLTNSACLDTSSCMTIPTDTVVGPGPSILLEEKLNSQVTIFPNPTEGRLSIQSNELIGKVILTDISGKVVFETEVNNVSGEINIESIPQGSYTMTVENGMGRTVQKVIKLND